MNSRSAEQSLATFIQLTTHLQGLLASLNTGAGEDQLSHASGMRAVHNLTLLCGEACVGKIDADVD